MTMEIKMLKAIADAALEMAMAMQAVVDDCAEQLAKRKAAGEAESAVWEEPFAKAGQKAESGHEANQGAQVAPESNTSTSGQSSEPPLTIVELRAFVAEKSTPENRPVIKEILTQHGVKKLTELKENQYRSVLEAVRKACK